MRYFYSLVLFLVLPFLFLRLWWRSRHHKAYRERWVERLGAFPHQISAGGLWLHAVSLGEAIAAAPLIKVLLAEYPSTPLIVTSTTPTGSAYIVKQFKDQVVHTYLPFDLSFLINRFLKKTQPKICIIMETELWPNLLHACCTKKIPLVLANARLSPNSAKGYARVKFFVANMLNSFTKVIAQSELDAERFLNLGLEPSKLMVSGNIKFDLQLSPDLSARAQVLCNQWGDRVVWIAASTHEGEEETLLNAFKSLHEKNPRLLLVIVPRHANRFDKVAELCVRHGLTVARRSLNELPNSACDIYLADTFGEMMLFYAVADFAFVGGSLVSVGGHNLIEPAALGLPILSGPKLHNFMLISELLLAHDALKIVHDAEEVSDCINRFIENPAETKRMGLRALAVADANRGAVEKHRALIAELMQCRSLG